MGGWVSVCVCEREREREILKSEWIALEPLQGHTVESMEGAE